MSSAFVACAQTVPAVKAETKANKGTNSDQRKEDSKETLIEQRRMLAISVATSLADEARSYRDLGLRARVTARVADALWEANNEFARTLFRRAWDAAEAADAETDQQQNQVQPSNNKIARAGVIENQRIPDKFRRRLPDLRSEVLRLAGTRDRALGEALLKKWEESNQRQSDPNNSATGGNGSDDWGAPAAAFKRLQLARRLLDQGDVDRAMDFAGPVVDQVNVDTIGFLCALREKRPQAADQGFVYLLNRAERDPFSDANTVSGLESYAFTPALYVSFTITGPSWNSENGPDIPPNLPPAIRDQFFRVATSILLRPLPPPNQDQTSQAHVVKYFVIKRLLPLFDQYAPESAALLRAQLVELIAVVPNREKDLDTSGLIGDAGPEAAPGEKLEKMQDRIDNAKTSSQRDSIYAEVAAVLAEQGDIRARDLVEKIDDSDARSKVHGYVDLDFLVIAVNKKDVAEIARLTKTGELSHTQRAWGYTQAARLILKSDRPASVDFLEAAALEAQRLDADDPERSGLLFAVASQFITIDRPRAWEILDYAIKAANASEKFTGEQTEIRARLFIPRVLKFKTVATPEFDLRSTFRLLVRDDLDRSLEMARHLMRERPRATAMLAIVSSVLKERK